MKLLLGYILLAYVSIFSEEKVDPLYVQQSKNDPQYSPNIRKAEEVLNKNIAKANEALAEYSNILTMKLGSLPHKTIATKGTTKGDDCIPNPNQNESADCLKVEQFDFVEGEKGQSQGPKTKSITLFFAIASKTEGENKTGSQGKLLKIKSRVFSHNLYTTDKKMIEVLDTSPLGNPDHDDKIYITNQIDNSFSSSNSDLSGDSNIGKYQLNSIENTKSNPLRNHFKREAYIKHLLSFEKVLSKIFYYNDSNGNKK